MSDSSDQRQFEASAARLRKARQDGDVARSADLSGAVAFAAALAALAVVLPTLGSYCRSALSALLAQPGTDAPLPLVAFIVCALVPIAAAACAAVVASVLQGGGLHIQAPALKIERLNPAEGLRRMLSRQSASSVARGVAAVGCLVAVLIPVLHRVLAQGFDLNDASLLADLAWTGALRVGFAGAAAALLFGGLDFAFVFGRWRRRLRMTFQELKRDQKENEGDPLIHSRRRLRQRESSREALRRIEQAAFVVANPQHIAIALEYRLPAVAVPRVLIRAAEEAALRVRKAAVERGVPIVEDLTLARSLYATTQPGESIPVELYVAVAAIVVRLARRGALVS